MVSKISLFVPEGRVNAVPISPAPHLGEVQGKVVAFMQNGKPNADILMTRLAELMQKKHGVAEALLRAKPRATEPAEFVDELAKQCQGVVNAIGD